MIGKRVREIIGIEYADKMMIYDLDNFASYFDYVLMLRSDGVIVYLYDDVERIRLEYETEIKSSQEKVAIIVSSDIYVPSDIKKQFFCSKLSLTALYPKMDKTVLDHYINDLDLVDRSYSQFDNYCLHESETEYHINNVAFSEQNISEFIEEKERELKKLVSTNPNYSTWIKIAKTNAKLEKYACMHGISRNQSFLDKAFFYFISEGYEKLATIVSSEAPTILPKVLDKLSAEKKVAVVVMDGMSLFDFEVLSEFMSDYDYSYNASYALIPTTTSISRQSLLAGKYPQELPNPFSLAKEETQFYEAAAERGYSKTQSFYGRGYEALPGLLVKFAAIIINDIDDMVHGQKQGRMGMYNDVRLLGKEGKLQLLISSLLDRQFTVYLTADHGNTNCTGGGSIKKLGVETETRSKRTVVLKDFADVNEDLQSRTYEYPGYYLSKDYKYRICNGRTSFDNKNENVMTHGGISIEEVIVPFVEIRGKKHG